MNIRKLTAGIAAIAACGALLTACGRNDDSMQSTPDTTTTTTPATTPTTTEPTTTTRATESHADTNNSESGLESGIAEGADRIENGVNDAARGARNVVDDLMGRR